MAQDPFKYFRIEAHELLEQFEKGILDLEKGERSAEVTQRMLRVAHTLKGASRVVKQAGIAEQSHAIEDVLQPFREASAPVPRERIDRVLERVAQIRRALGALAAAPGPETSQAGTKAVVEEESLTVRAEIAEMDGLLEGISETHSSLRALEKTAGGIERAHQLSELLLEQLTRPGAHDSGSGSGGSLDKLRSLASDLEAQVSALDQKLGTAIEQVQRELGQVRAAAEQLRLLQAGSSFTSLERSARDTAHALAKQISFEAKGGEVRLDARVLETVRGALVQLIRNAVAHGIESPSERAAAGKPGAGRIRVHISRRGRRVLFSCEDDGRGIDLDGVRAMLQRRGLSSTETARFGPEELLRKLLEGGISTSTRVTEVSGRGIGLDVVREAAARLGGNVTIRTETGRGTTFEIVVPLSVASLEGLVVEADGALATLPLDSIRRTLRLVASDITRTEQGDAIVYDGTAIPFLPLGPVLRPGPADAFGRPRSWSAVVLDAEGMAAVGVDRLLGTATVVLRPLPEHAPASRIVAGASLDADGNPQLVLDPEELVAAARIGRSSFVRAQPERRPILVIDDSMTTRMLEQSILESAGYAVDTASSAEEGLECARLKPYALFLVDIEMPGMDGFTFVERTRADPELGRTPAILVTSLSTPEHRQRGKDAGAAGYVVKSEFDQADLLARIRSLLE